MLEESILYILNSLYYPEVNKNTINAIVNPRYFPNEANNIFKPHLFRKSIYINDVLNLSKTMNVEGHNKYDCALEIANFIRIDIREKGDYSLKGYFWNKVPENYIKKYSAFRNQQCIEVEKDVILIAPYNNTFTKSKVNDGDLVNIIPQSNLNLKCVFKRIG